jgi:hypothetical protein
MDIILPREDTGNKPNFGDCSGIRGASSSQPKQIQGSFLTIMPSFKLTNSFWSLTVIQNCSQSGKSVWTLAPLSFNALHYIILVVIVVLHYSAGFGIAFTDEGTKPRSCYLRIWAATIMKTAGGHNPECSRGERLLKDMGCYHNENCWGP